MAQGKRGGSDETARDEASTRQDRSGEDRETTVEGQSKMLRQTENLDIGADDLAIFSVPIPWLVS